MHRIESSTTCQTLYNLKVYGLIMSRVTMSFIEPETVCYINNGGYRVLLVNSNGHKFVSPFRDALRNLAKSYNNSSLFQTLYSSSEDRV